MSKYKLKPIEQDREEFLTKVKNNPELDKVINDFHIVTAPLKYAYNFDWLGRPVIQLPQDILIMQDILWKIKPDLIIETGVARGGSLIFYSSILTLIDVANEKMGLKTNVDSEIWGIDIKIHDENKQAIDAHPFSEKIKIFEESSTNLNLVDKLREKSKKFNKVLVILDSDHTAEHVLNELKLYTPFVSVDSYCVVFDSTIEDLPPEHFKDRDWGPGNSPRTAVNNFLKSNTNFQVDEDLDSKLLLTAAAGGFLKKITK
jgi:cephalosporin hydroxylase